MYSRYNIPQYGRNMQNYNRPRPPRPPYQGNNDRFFGGGFIAPFILGGITGSLLRPNYPIYSPGPPIYPYPPYRPYW